MISSEMWLVRDAVVWKLEYAEKWMGKFAVRDGCKGEEFRGRLGIEKVECQWVEQGRYGILH